MVFGKAKIEDVASRTQTAVTEKLKSLDIMSSDSASSSMASQPIQEEEEEDGKIDYKGIEKKDVELVCAQTQVTKRKAIETLLKNNNDVVNAIMTLTM